MSVTSILVDMYSFNSVSVIFIGMYIKNFNIAVSFSMLAFSITNIECLTSSHLPELLVPCYNGSFNMENKPPLTVKLLVETLRKIELNEKISTNLRILQTTLLHRIIFDGILKSERGIGDNEAFLYRARGREFHKYKLVTDYLVTGASTLSLNESLSQHEICFLHNMLSVTTDKHYRGDEDITCNFKSSKTPIPTVELQIQNNKYSACPRMKGNLFTKWGSVTPGHLVYGLSAALENTETSFDTILKEINKTGTKFGSDKANSVWISTIAGDLAEALLNQASDELKLGILGFWNDSSFPINYYLSDYSSDLVESMLLGGIDSLILASNILTWEKTLMSTRFSQIIDMYYSNRGISYNSTIKASNRKVIFSEILKKTNLTHQVIGAATLLKEIANYDRFLSDNDIREMATLAVDKFEAIIDDILRKYDSVEYVDVNEVRSSLEIIIIMDGSFDHFTSKKLIYSLAEAMDVSYYGSKLGIINGENGKWISNVTGQIYTIFNDIENSKSSWPSKLSLGLSLQKIFEYYLDEMTKGCESPKKPLGRTVIILSKKAKPSNSDLDAYKAVLFSLKNAFPDINIIYALSHDIQQFYYDLPNRYKNDSYVNIADDIETISNSLGKILQRIPGQIVNIYCNDSNSRMEDYLTPGVERFYEIHEEYINKYNFELEFLGNGYGDISICSNSFGTSSIRSCKNITANNKIKIKSADLCSEDLRCNLQLILKVNSSTLRCVENDCRYPDQVRLEISWLKSGSAFYTANIKFLSIILFIKSVCFT
ncbi:uncharacterized protein LOC123686516 isoform X2 [Harmonia axyridis]|uniref:uncharacterized protein LOC123686516 isoform X2 n=1 Tax=Harmonia axyridis TaxID=115357 RepID=UPI001E278B21|nr:uncharacterized protein LOC123686516 isoform X2 [Harmonia axyridis]